MKKRIIIPLTILVIILTLAILSITIKSVNWDVDEISEVNSTTELARLISLHPDKFWNATIDEIFSKNTRKRHNGTYGLDGNEKENPAEYVDIYYHTAACIFHDQTDKNGDKYAHKITNIIEIESPGIMTVHKYTGDRGNSKYESETLDLSTEGSAKAVFDKMKEQGIIGKNVTFNYDNMKKDITAFAYLINQTTENAKKANPVASNSYAYTSTKNAIHWFWKQPGGTIAIRKYAKATGKLDSYYYNAQKQNDEVVEEAVEKRKEALDAAISAIQPAMIEKLNTSSQTLTISYVNDKAYIGPLKVKYSGGTPTVKINIGENKENWITASGWVTYDSAKETFNNVQKGSLTSGQEFYAVTDKAKVEALSKINVKVELEYMKYSAKLALTTSKTNDSQNLMFYMGKEEKKVITVDWQEERSKKIEIQKQDENGNVLKQSGIKFEVYDEAGKLIETLTTKNDGKTNSGLVPNTVYTIKETVNNAYGYKNASIKDATITGGTITEKTAEHIKVKITDDAVITIKNAPELGKLTIEKVDENGKGIEGVEFVIWQIYKGYLSIEGQATHTTTSEGTDMKAMYESGKIVYPAGDTTEEKLAKATRYITNKEGKIVLNNLEIYNAKGQIHEYIIREMSNPNYGYKGMVMTNENIILNEAQDSDIKGTFVEDMYVNDTIKDGGKDALRKKAQFTIGRDTTVKMVNTPKLGNLVIHKKDGKTNLEDVEFILYKAVSNGKGFIRLSQRGQFVEMINTEIDITDYEVEYVDTVEKATVLKTNEDGKIIVNNLEIYSGIDENYNPVKYEYYIYEKSNDGYGYKHMTVTIEDVTIDGGTIIDINEGMGKVDFTLSEKTATVTVEIDNTIKVADLVIKKVNKENEPIGNVEFVIERGKGEYILLKNSTGETLKSVVGTVTINIDENFETDEYSIEYVNSKEIATRFVTGTKDEEKGKVIIKNFEVYSGKDEKYSYTAYEVANDNYGYGSIENSNLSKTIDELKLNETNELVLENAKHLGEFAIIKYDGNRPKIKLPNVGFVIEQTSEVRGNILGQYAYLALYDEQGKFVPSIKKEAIINRNNKAEIGQYEVRYYYTKLQYNGLSNEEKAKITTFVTDDYGNISIKNLEVYSPLLKDANTDLNKYTYKPIEIYNGNYGYKLDEEKQTDLKVKLLSGNTITENIPNVPTMIKISGYVWLENSGGKSNQYDLVYKDGEKDIKLVDLYITENGETVKNSQAKIPVEIMLRDKTTGKILKMKPDEFDENGKYTFIDVEIENLKNNEVVFVYDGFYYTTIIQKLDISNASKVKENEKQRTELNNLFGTVKDDNEIITVDGKNNTLEYIKEGRTSTVSKFNFNTKIQANTTDAQMNFAEIYEKMTGPDQTTIFSALDDINMGLVLREQPALSIGSQIHSVEVSVNDYKYTYNYNGRQQHYHRENNDEYGVKFETEKGNYRYEQKVYSSDVEALKNGAATMNVSIIYKISISNDSKTLTSVVREIENYFDKELTIEKIGLALNENKEIVDEITEKVITENVPVKYEDGVIGEGNNYNSARIKLKESGIELKKDETKDIYIKFSVSQEAIKGLLSGKSTYHNATEIVSYSTYYGDTTGKGKVYISEEEYETTYISTEQKASGEVYAGINRKAAPGNIQLILKTDSREPEGTHILNNDNFEIDETSAPSLLLVAEEARKIEGVVWEDMPTQDSLSRHERLGDGKYDKENEKPIKNVLVTLRTVNENGTVGDIAKYSDKNNAITETNEKGEYTLGYYDGEKYVGILPGKYFVEYTYGQYLNGEEQKITTIVGKENVNPLDYKSTIITSGHIENAFENEGTEKWFATEDNTEKYSNAIDDITLREEYLHGEFTVNNASYQNDIKLDNMKAYTPMMDIGIEFTEKDEVQALSMQRIVTLKDVDFGIIERPRIDIVVKKKITGFEVVAQDGKSVIPMGNPSDLNSKMQGVKKLDEIVSAEIDAKLLQGALLNLEYTISVKNDSDVDYFETRYYYYGKDGVNRAESTAKLVVDYLHEGLLVDKEKNDSNIWKETTSADLATAGYIDDNVKNGLESEKYTIFTTDAFKDVTAQDEKEVKLYASKVLSSSIDIREENDVEIIELTGKRTIKNAIPGNHNPAEAPKELDSAEAILVATAPTGLTVNYTLYIIAAVATLAIIGIGILIIKKKIIK